MACAAEERTNVMSYQVPPLPLIPHGALSLYGTPVNGDAIPTDLSTCISPDALMAYCESRMNGIDTEIKKTFDQQQKTNQEQQILGDALQTIQAFGDGTLDPKSLQQGTNPEQCKQMELAIESAIQKIKDIDPSSPAIARLEAMHDKLMGTGSGPFNDNTGPHGYYNPDYKSHPPDGGHTEEDGNISVEEMKGFIDDLNNINSGLSSNSELQMINLQSLMSQRQTAVELTTNLVQSLDETTGKIVGNVGH
jgi:hypothetical protein